jgi:serine/threonine protein kinase
MPLHANSQLLVDHLSSLQLLDGRFANIRLANWNPLTNQKRGSFSLVFYADDVLEGKPVALKFYDLDPAWANDKYRRASFLRESDILKQLLDAERCLQLVKEMSDYHLTVSVPGAGPIVLACQYFVVEWLSDEIDNYFLAQQQHEPVEKLKLFNEIILGVEALHRRRIFHRDLKADNLRATLVALKRLIVAIDLGTAARFDSGHIALGYSTPVGAQIYAPSESFCGLAGNRDIAPYSDLYAIGCLLFELFNADYFFRALIAHNSNIAVRISAMQHVIAAEPPDKHVELWCGALCKFGVGIAPVPIDGAGSNVPPGIAYLLNEILAALTHFDYRKRPIDLASVRQRVWVAIRLLQNQTAYERKLKLAREFRRRRLEHAKKVAARRIPRDVPKVDPC